MAIDFEAFAETTDERIIESTRAAGLKNPREGKLGNRGEPDMDKFVDDLEREDEFVRPNNADARLVLVRGWAVPALGFFAQWQSGASFCLTEWHFGPIDWARS